jgi:hypothetical protein
VPAIPNTKDAEKDRTAAAVAFLKLSRERNGVVDERVAVPLVSSRCPPDVTMAVPSRVRLAPAKP